MLQTNKSVFKRHDRILSGLLLGSLREREVIDLCIQAQRSVHIRCPASSLLVSGTHASQYYCVCSVPNEKHFKSA